MIPYDIESNSGITYSTNGNDTAPHTNVVIHVNLLKVPSWRISFRSRESFTACDMAIGTALISIIIAGSSSGYARTNKSTIAKVIINAPSQCKKKNLRVSNIDLIRICSTIGAFMSTSIV